jgi:dethiobiotin synthetase
MGVDKTRVTGGLLKATHELQALVAGMKPVVAGGKWHDWHLIGDNALYISHNAGQITPSLLLNPYRLPEPLISPALPRTGPELGST